MKRKRCADRILIALPSKRQPIGLGNQRFVHFNSSEIEINEIEKRFLVSPLLMLAVHADYHCKYRLTPLLDARRLNGSKTLRDSVTAARQILVLFV